jgi:hypothetical protein
MRTWSNKVPRQPRAEAASVGAVATNGGVPVPVSSRITVALANVTGSPRAKSRPPDGARYMRERLKAQEEAE